jgi:hypothetical protein
MPTWPMWLTATGQGHDRKDSLTGLSCMDEPSDALDHLCGGRIPGRAPAVGAQNQDSGPDQDHGTCGEQPRLESPLFGTARIERRGPC